MSGVNEVINPMLQSYQSHSSLGDAPNNSNRSAKAVELSAYSETSPSTQQFRPSQFYRDKNGGEDDSDDDEDDIEEVTAAMQKTMRSSMEGGGDTKNIDVNFIVNAQEAVKEKKNLAPPISTANECNSHIRSYCTGFMGQNSIIKALALYDPFDPISDTNGGDSNPSATSATSATPTRSAASIRDTILSKRLIISGDQKGQIRVWDALSCEAVYSFEKNQSCSTAVGSGQRSSIQVIVVHDPKRAQSAAEEQGGGGGGCSGISTSYKGAVLVLSGGYDLAVTIWNLASGCPLRTLVNGHTWYVCSLLVHYIPVGVFDVSEVEFADNSQGVEKSNRMVVLSSSYDNMQVWDLNTGAKLFRINTSATPNEKQFRSNAVTMTAINVDGGALIRGQYKGGQTHVLAGLYDKRFVMIDISKKNGAIVFDTAAAVPSVVNGVNTYTSTLSNGEEALLAITGNSNGAAYVWSTQDNVLVSSLEGIHSKSVVSVAIICSPARHSGRRLAALRRRSQQAFSAVSGGDLQRLNKRITDRRKRKSLKVLRDGLFEESGEDPMVLGLPIKATIAAAVGGQQDAEGRERAGDYNDSDGDDDDDAEGSDEDDTVYINPNVYLHLYGLLAMTGSADGLVCIWDLTAGWPIRLFESPGNSPITVSLVNMDMDNITTDGKKISFDKKKDPGNLFRCLQYHDSLSIITASAAGSMISYDVSAYSHTRFQDGYHDDWIVAATSCVPPVSEKSSVPGEVASTMKRGEYILSGDVAGKVVCWNPVSGSVRYQCTVATTEPGPEVPKAGCAGLVYCAVSWEDLLSNTPGVASTNIIRERGAVEFAEIFATVPAEKNESIKLHSVVDGSIVYRYPTPLQVGCMGATLWCPSVPSVPPAYPKATAAASQTVYWFDRQPKLIITHRNGSVSIYNFLSGECVRSISNTDIGINIAAGAITVVEYVDSTGLYKPTVMIASSSNVLEIDLLSCSVLRQFSQTHSDNVRFTQLYEPVPGFNYNSDVLSERLLITGGLDKTVVVRSYSSERVIRTLNVHKNAAVMAAAVYDPTRSTRQDSYRTHDGVVLVVLITCSSDGKVVMSCLDSGTILHSIQDMHGMTTGIRTMSLFIPIWFEKGPFVITYSDRGSIVMSDIEYPTGFHLPPAQSIFDKFDLDMRNTVLGEGTSKEPWSNMAELYRKFGSMLFKENPKLFAKAIFHKRNDFLRMFNKALVEVLPYVGNVVPNRNCLQYAMDCKDLGTLRVLLKSWAECLNRDAVSLRDHIMDHPSNYLSSDTIINLAHTFPSEFNHFISSLKVVQAAPEVCQRREAVLSDVYRNLVVTCDTDDTQNLWGRLLRKQRASGQPVTPMFVPLKTAASVSMIQAYLSASEAQSNSDIFDAEIVIVALRHAWDSFGRQKNQKLTIGFISFLFFYCFALYSFQSFINQGRVAIALIVQSIFAVTLAHYFRFLSMRIIRRVRHEARLRHEEVTWALRREILFTYFFSGIWNIHDWVTSFLMLLGTLQRLTHANENDLSRSYFAVSSFLIFFKTLYFLRPLPSSGPLVAMVIEIGFSMRFFLIIMATLLFGVSQSFWLMYNYNDTNEIGWTLFRSFTATLGDFDTDFAGSANPMLTLSLLVCFLMFMSVLMLNLLIALMGDVYSRVSESGLKEWRKNQAGMLLDMVYDDSNVDDKESSIYDDVPYLHILRYSSDVIKYNNTENEDTDEVLSRIDEVVNQTADLQVDFTAMGKNVKQCNAQIRSLEKKMDDLTSKLDTLTTHILAAKDK